MSRGWGDTQWFLFRCARAVELIGKPWTFDEFCHIAHPECYEPEFKMKAGYKRSLRRALRRLTEEHVIIPLGLGGRADPTRYCIHPQFLDADDPIRTELMKHLEPFGFYWGPDGNLMIRHHH